MTVGPENRRVSETAGELPPEVLDEIRYGTSDPKGGVMPEARDKSAGMTPLDDKHLRAQLEVARRANQNGVLDRFVELGEA